MGVKFNPLIFSGFDLTGSSGGGGAVTSVNGQSGIVVLDADDVGAANQSLSNLTTTAINQSLLFNADAAYNIGSSTEQVQSVNAVIVQGTNNLDLYANNGNLTFGAPGGSDINLTKISGSGALEMKFYDDAGSFYSGIKAASDLSTAGSSTLTLPEGVGTSGQVLSTDGTGILSWAAGVPVLTVGSIPFSDGVTLIEDNANLFWDNTNKVLAVGTNPAATSFAITVQRDSTDDAVQAGSIYARHNNFLTATNPNLSSAGSFDAHFQADTGVSSSGGAAVLFNAFRDLSSDMGTLSFLVGAFGGATQQNTDPTATTNLLAGILSQVNVNSGTATSTADFYGLAGNLTGGTIGTQYGIYIEPSNIGFKNNWLSGVTQIGGASFAIDAAASLDLNENDKALLLNRLDNTAEGAIGVNGMIIYNTDQNKFRGYENGVWSDFIGANTALSNLTTTNINQSLGPSADDTFNIGSIGSRWATVFASAIRSSGNITLNTAVGFNIDISGDGFASGVVPLRFFDADQAEFAAIKAPAAVSASYTLTLPVDDGTSGQVLSTDGSGVLSWLTPAAAGANTTLSNLGTVAFNANLVPDANITRDVGSSSNALNAVHASTYNFTNGTFVGKIQKFSGSDTIVGEGFTTSDVNLEPTGGLALHTTNKSTGPSGKVVLASGLIATSGNSGLVKVSSGEISAGSGTSGITTLASGDSTGNSGNVVLQTGTAVTTRGNAVVSANSLVLPISASDPASNVVAGSIYYNSTTNKIKMYNGTTWETVTSI